MIPEPTICIGTAHHADGWGCRREVGGHHVLDIHGTDEQIGRFYGQLLRTEMIDKYAPMTEQMIRDLPAGFRNVLSMYERRYPDYFDSDNQRRVTGLETALGWPAGTMLRYDWMTDLASIGPAVQLAVAGTVQWDGVRGMIDTSRCTSIIGRDGDATVHARNLDFWGMGFWQPNATLLFVEPLNADGSPDGFRYAHAGTVGEIFAASTGVNEMGLVVTVHLHASRDVALVNGAFRTSAFGLVWRGLTGPRARRGASVYALTERILRRAATVADAKVLLATNSSLGAWSFVVSDPSGASAVIGDDAREVRWTDRPGVVTNFYLDSGMHARELVPARGPVEGARLRYARAKKLLGGGESLTVPAAMAMLRDQHDPATQTERTISANTIVSPDTSQSIVIRSTPGGDPEIWIAHPFSDGYTPAPYGAFERYSFHDGFSGSAVVRETLPGVTQDPVSAAYIDAMRLQLDVRDSPAALTVLRNIQTDDPAIPLMAALLAAHLGDLEGARADLRRYDVASGPVSVHHRILADCLRGELAMAARHAEDALAAWRAAQALINDDDSESADLNHIAAEIIGDRIERHGHGTPRFPEPNLKFQDILEWRTSK